MVDTAHIDDRYWRYFILETIDQYRYQYQYRDFKPPTNFVVFERIISTHIHFKGYTHWLTFMYVNLCIRVYESYTGKCYITQGVTYEFTPTYWNTSWVTRIHDQNRWLWCTYSKGHVDWKSYEMNFLCYKSIKLNKLAFKVITSHSSLDHEMYMLESL